MSISEQRMLCVYEWNFFFEILPTIFYETSACFFCMCLAKFALFPPFILNLQCIHIFEYGFTLILKILSTNLLRTQTQLLEITVKNYIS